MGYVERSLLDGEGLIYLGRSHWLPVFAAPAGALLVALLLWPGGSLIGPLLLILGALLLALQYAAWSAQEFALTDRRAILKEGVFARRIQEVPLRTVESVALREGLAGRLAGYATLEIVGTGGSKITWPAVPDPLAVKTDLQLRVARARVRRPGNVRRA